MKFSAIAIQLESYCHPFPWPTKPYNPALTRTHKSSKIKCALQLNAIVSETPLAYLILVDLLLLLLLLL